MFLFNIYYTITMSTKKKSLKSHEEYIKIVIERLAKGWNNDNIYKNPSQFDDYISYNILLYTEISKFIIHKFLESYNTYQCDDIVTSYDKVICLYRYGSHDLIILSYNQLYDKLYHTHFINRFNIDQDFKSRICLRNTSIIYSIYMKNNVNYIRKEGDKEKEEEIVISFMIHIKANVISEIQFRRKDFGLSQESKISFCNDGNRNYDICDDSFNYKFDVDSTEYETRYAELKVVQLVV